MGKGFKGIPKNVQQEVEKVKEKIKVVGVVYDVEHEPTTRYDVEVEPTIKYETVKKPNTFWETVKKNCIQWITNIKYCDQWITTVKKCIKWETEVKPTVRYEVNVEPTTRYEEKVEPTTRYEVKLEQQNVEEMIEKVLKKIADKNAVTVPKPKFVPQTIIVSEFVIKCPECGCEHSIGGMKK